MENSLVILLLIKKTHKFHMKKWGYLHTLLNNYTELYTFLKKIHDVQFVFKGECSLKVPMF